MSSILSKKDEKNCLIFKEVNVRFCKRRVADDFFLIVSLPADFSFYLLICFGLRGCCLSSLFTKGNYFYYLTKGQRYKNVITSLQFANNRFPEGALFAPLLLQRLESAALPSGHEPLY